MNLIAEVANEAEAHTQLPIPAEAFGLIALAGMVVLLLVTYSFRNAAGLH